MIKIHFFIRYNTHFGESLLLSGNIPQLGDENPAMAITMNYLNETYWSYDLELDSFSSELPETIHYYYLFKDKKGRITEEWRDGKMIELSKITAEDIYVIDAWNFAGQFENTYFTAPFQETLLRAAKSEEKPLPYRGHTHILKVKAPLLQKNETLGLLGSGAILGEWDIHNPVWMKKEDNWWVAKINLSDASFPIAYKYVVYNRKDKTFIRYEDGDNRLLTQDTGKKRATLIHDGFAHFAHTSWRGAGVVIPVFSLRSQNSLGAGEFTDIKLLVDWAKKTGLQMIQLLPVNDTTDTGTWKDSYPYNIVSAFALHPIYLNLEEVAREEDAALIKGLPRKRRHLNERKELDYEAVMEYKWKIIAQLYEAQKRDFFKSKAFRRFREHNDHWLAPYAVYCFLRDTYKTTRFGEWKQYSVCNKTEVEKLTEDNYKGPEETGIYYFVQYHLHQQLKAASAYAHAKGIILKGDLPIGVNRFSCDVWMEPELFHLNRQAGAPPDAFATKGQNWGFPTYNWDRMKTDGYNWWQRRFKHMSHYFDAFRIDHILGFFRIWSIPEHAVEGVMGHFVPALPVDVNDLTEKGISFDYNRYCKPYITDDVLAEIAGKNRDLIIEFLDRQEDGSYTIKPAFSNQRLVEEYFATQNEAHVHSSLLSILYDLISNVILIEEEGSEQEQFHFRIDIEHTSSFRHLDHHTQEQLRSLYLDYFFSKQDDLWATEAMYKLPALKKSTQMLICGEDLGMVPHCVPEIMRQTGILGLEIQRMPKQEGIEFAQINRVPYLSVITPSTHDMSTIRGWWEENRGKTQRFFNQEMQHPGLAPYYCEPWVNKAVVIQHLYSSAMWSVFLLQDLMGIDGKLRREIPQEERINVPAIPRYYWRYRMHLTLEQLLKEDDFNNELRSYIRSSGREKS